MIAFTAVWLSCLAYWGAIQQLNIIPRAIKHNDTNFLKYNATAHALKPYLLGLLAMIKCSICSYQCDNWYVSNWRLACHINFCLGRCSLELAQGPSSVALAWHLARSSTPFGVTTTLHRIPPMREEGLQNNARHKLWNYSWCFLTKPPQFEWVGSILHPSPAGDNLAL